MEKCPSISLSPPPKPEPEPEPESEPEPTWLLQRTEELHKTDWQRPGSVDVFLQCTAVTVQFKVFFIRKFCS